MTIPVRNARLKLSQGLLFWREVGHGKTLVFLHDAWNDGNAWMPTVEQLSSHYHCVVPDLLGFGESQRPRLNYSIGLQVEGLVEWLETLRLNSVVLVGQGLGGWIANSLALRHPEIVRSLILLSPEGVEVPGTTGRWTWARWLMMRPPIALWCLKAIAPIARLLKFTAIDHLLQQRKRWQRSPVACRLLFQRRAAAIRAERVQDQLGWLKVPVLLLLGDRASPLSTTLTQAYSVAPQATIQVVPGGDNLLEVVGADWDGKAIATQIHSFVKGVC